MSVCPSRLCTTSVLSVISQVQDFPVIRLREGAVAPTAYFMSDAWAAALMAKVTLFICIVLECACDFVIIISSSTSILH
jgi:hypothetical protein